jgi:hypothetical protein
MVKNLLDWIVTEKLKINPKTSLATTELEDGLVDIQGGIVYTYDGARAKWLSVQRQTFIFGRSGTTADQYLNFAGGGISSKSGYRMPRNACVVGMTVQTSNSKNYLIHLRKNDNDAADLVTLTVAGTGQSNTTINREIYANDYLQCYLEFTGTGYGVDDPIVMIEVAWRG